MTSHVERDALPELKLGSKWYQGTPWWLLIIIFIILAMVYQVVTDEEYGQAFEFIRAGIGITIYSTFVAFLIAGVIGLLAGLGRVSTNTVIRTLSVTYVEFIRGVPMLVLIFTVALVIVPTVSGWIGLGNRAVSSTVRGVISLSAVYGAFMAEIFRAGIESIPSGQMEAARSLGMTRFQAMRNIILPQAIRNILPALGNDFIAMLKDSSLLSVLAVDEITYKARLYSGSSFRFRETYLVLTVLYLTMTLVLSLALQQYEKRINRDRER